ncbi:serine threonine phosphatase [Fusarium sporotrichioides]|uniref:Serine threonine phosphatase n=1 Tax=Fusarium sporotrichioides TaxID=5514 RepID=A0A395SJU3_FUSSP|nr:serine threonine phosphatase [Fusarium sporotrichioides]
MYTAPYLRLSMALLILSATDVLAADDEKDNTDFLLNVFSDIGPILALFGEQFARQFLSETFTWEDHLIFACVPLGIITAISGAIRVQGHGFFKAIIGRARENHAAAEIEYMSSTSTEVCELYNGQGIIRTMGKPYIGQIIICPDQFPDGTQQVDEGESCGIHTLETAKNSGIMRYQEYRVESRPRPRPLKWFVSSQAPKENIQDHTGLETEQLRDLETGTGRGQDVGNHDTRQGIFHGAETAPSELARNSGRHEPRQSIPQNGRISSHGQDSSHNPSQSGHNFEKKDPWLTLKSPNLQLNIPCEDVSEQKHRSHLVLAAMIALTLQVALLVIAMSTVYFISGFEPEPWGLPCYLGGSVLLFFGMIACSVAIEKRTRELTWYIPVAESKDRQEFHLLWVQRNQRVSEQDFGCYVIDGGTRRHIMTSSRREDLEGLESTRPPVLTSADGLTGNTNTSSDHTEGSVKPKLSILTLLPFIAVSFGGIGFTVQFIGLRGLPWPCAVSQLGAMIIMAIIRAIVRRRLATPLSHHSVLEKHELDYLAIQLVNKKGKLFEGAPEQEVDSGQQVGVCARVWSALNRMAGDREDEKQQSSAEVLVWKVDTASSLAFEPNVEPDVTTTDPELELIFRSGFDTTGTVSNNSGSQANHSDEGQRAILVRKRLGDLCQWPDSTSKPALALTRSIQRFMKEFFPYGLPTNDPARLTWKIPFSRSNQSDQATPSDSSDQTVTSWVKLHVTRDASTNAWNADNGQIEAVLSLWMSYWTARRAVHLSTEMQENAEKGKGTDWRQTGDGSLVEYCRKVGDNRNRVLERDISWWVNNRVAGLWSEHPNSREESHDDTSSGKGESRFSFGFNCVKSSSSFKTSGSSAISISSKLSGGPSMSGSSVMSGSSATSGSPKVSSSSEISQFLVHHSTADLVTVMAQHLFTCFIWNIGSLLPMNIFNRQDVHMNQNVKVESSPLPDPSSSIKAQSGRRLSHRKLTQFVNYAEKQGLGTSDEILLCIIPTFSFFDCLPNNIILAYDQLLAKPFGSFDLKEQRAECIRQINLLRFVRESTDLLEEEYLSLAAVVNAMEFVYLTALHVAKAKVCRISKKVRTHPEELSVLLGDLFKHFGAFLRKLSPFYDLQRRRQTLTESFNDTKMGNRIADFLFSGWNEQEQDNDFTHKIGFTNWHRRVVDLKPTRRLNLRTLLTVVGNGTGRDVFGWTPLHYAAARPELQFKPERRTESEDPRLETTLNYNIQADRWVDKFRRSPFHIAAAAGNINLLRILLPYLKSEAKVTMFKGGVDEMNPLHLAAQGNHRNCKNGTQQDPAEGNCKKCIVTLLKHRPPIHSYIDAWKQSPIHTAVTNQCYECTFVLLECQNVNFSPETPDEFKKPFMSYLDESNDAHRPIGERLLLKHYKKFDNGKRWGDNILHHAIKFLRYRSDFRQLLRSLKDTPVDVTNIQGQTPLYLAVSAKRPNLAGHLVIAGASSSAKDKNGISPMILCCQRGDAVSARILLLDVTYRGDERDAKGKTALHHAASSKWPDDDDCLEIVQRLADVMKSIDVRDQDDKTPLQSAVEANQRLVCIALLRRKASIKLVSISRLSALNYIVRSDIETDSILRAEWGKQIRDETQNRVNDQDKDGNTALHRAVQDGDDDTVNWLMQNNADLQIENNAGGTAFIQACSQDKCHRFIKHVADVLDSRRPRSLADQMPQPEADVDIEQLDSSKMNVWSLDSNRFNINNGDYIYDQSALAWACENGHEQVVQILLGAHTIDIRRKASRFRHYTPLHFALEAENATIVELLLNHAEGHELLSETDKYGLTPINFAVENPNQKCLFQLIMHSKAGPGSFSCSDLASVLKVCSGDDIQVNDTSRTAWDAKAAEGFLDADKWTLADIAGKYGHPDLENRLRKTVYSTKMARPLRPSSFLSEYNGVASTNHPATNEGRTINIGLSYWVEKSYDEERFFYLRAGQPIPPDAQCFYFEVNIIHLSINQVFMLGFCGSDVPAGVLPGWNKGSWAYHSDDGGLYEGDDLPVTSNSENVCEVGDIMGCGVDFNTGKGYRTRNGRLLGSGDAFADPWLNSGKLYPCVGFSDDGAGDRLEVEISLPGPEGQSFERLLPQSK